MPTPADGLVAHSDALGVSSAQNLGAVDMIKLRAVVIAPPSTEYLLCALRRLSASGLSLGLSRSTGIDGAVGGLQAHEDAVVRDLSARIVSAWTLQLAEAQKIEMQKHRRGPKPKGTGSATCRACQGGHRAHTCGP